MFSTPAQESAISRPVFFIGMPRSGTTIMFEAFSRHPQLAWPTNYAETHPRSPAFNLLRLLLDNRWITIIGKKGQYVRGLPGNRYLPQPSEAYAFWNQVAHPEFARTYMQHVVVTDEDRCRIQHNVRKIMDLQRRPRFAAKLTGPPRMRYLAQIFPDALFVHVVRDGRAVVHSLMKVDFWKANGGFDGPYWYGGLDEQLLSEWNQSGRDPAVLAAIQWRHIITLARQEAAELPADNYLEVRYEEFVTDPTASIRRIVAAAGLQWSAAIERYLSRVPTMNRFNTKYQRDFTFDRIAAISRSMEPELSRHGYS